jgi:hypothetical protein
MAIANSKKKRIRQKNLELHRNQIRLNRVLAVLGVTDLHKTLHADFRESILKNPDPPIILECPDGTESKCRHILKQLGEWKALSYKGITASDFTEVMFPLIRYIGSAVGQKLMAEHTGDGFKKVSKEVFLSYLMPAREFLYFFLDQLSAVMQLVMWAESAPDRQYIKMKFGTDYLSNSRIRFKVTANIEQAKRIWIYGSWKYQVGTYHDNFFDSLTEMKWLSKCPLDYGLPGKADEILPVYISSHALDRLRERLDDQMVRMVTTFAIYFAMDKPVYHPLPDGSGDMLIALCVKDPNIKVGYLVVSRTEKEIIVKTFLFITMYQTPEGQRLHRRLRMARDDFDFHKLEHYSTLARSDLTTHPTLRPLWEECGFKGLLTMIDRGAKLFSTERKKQADDMIRYFRLDGH